jgi:small subunit ribosomal protein S8e
MTKLVSGEKRVRRIRVRGGNVKHRALRLSEGIIIFVVLTNYI